MRASPLAANEENLIATKAPISPLTNTQAAPDRYFGNLFFHRFMAALSAALLLSAVACVAFLNYRLSISELASCANFLPFIGAIAYCWWAKHYRLLQACSLPLWASILSTLLKFPLYIASRSTVALADPSLARADHALGLEIPTVLHFMAFHPWAWSTLAFSYDLLFPFMVVAAIIPALRFRFSATKELIVAISFATVVGSLLFAFLPAVGPWVTYGFPPSPLQSQTQALFLSLRTGSVHFIDFSEPGVVCFPSFHVLLAVLSATALCSVKPLRIPAVLIAALISLSTLTTDWHYVVDAICGLILAAISILVSKAYTRWEACRLRQTPPAQEISE
jgi:PAP2 superfamily